MDKRITRNKAAEILGVSRQTISNYIKDGLLGGFKDEKGNTYVNAEDIERYAKKYKFIAVSEEMLDKKLAEIKAAKEQANDELAEIRKALFFKHNYGACNEDVRNIITALYQANLAPYLKAREHKFLMAFLNDGNKSLHDLSEEHCLTPERCRQIISKACHKFYTQTKEIRQDIKTNKELKEEVESLKSAIKALQNDYDAFRIEHGEKQISDVVFPPKILSARFIDCDLSVRCLNCLKSWDIDTFEDLLTRYTCMNDLKNIRNFGNKTYYELSDLLEERNLIFKKSEESLEEYYIRLNKHLTEKEYERKD